MRDSVTAASVRVHSPRRTDAHVAWAFVALFHLVIAWMVTRPVFMVGSDVGAPLQVVFIRPVQVRSQPMARRDEAVAPRGSGAEPANVGAPQQPRVDQSVLSTDPALVVGDDEWDRGWTEPSDGIVFEHQPLASSFNPRPRPAPGRFRMQRQLSPEDVVRGVSQVLGFWPAGYTDDPCAGLDKAVEMLSQAQAPRDHDLLIDAMRERETYCK